MELENILQEINYYDDLDHYDDLLWQDAYRLPKVYIRDAENPFEMRADRFQKRYRFCQESVLFITSLLRSDLEKQDNRGLPIAPEIAVLLTLRFYATASFQIVCGDLLHISQPTASNIITKVSKLLAQLHTHYIKFPRGAEANRNRELFKEMGRHGQWPGLPGIDGAIDCTHVKIVSTPGCQHHEVFRNRKSDFSINVQVVAGPRREILDIVARWAGSMHDSRIFQMSSVYIKYTQGILNGRLVGDNGYPTLPFVLTPIRPAPEDAPSVRYNRAQIKTRNVVERTFGIWKRRFPCLSRGLGNKLSTVSHIIVSCAVLHNLSLILNDVMVFDENQNDEQEETDSLIPSTSTGFLIRNSIVENYYQ
ncbi:putative nuclease HARBI1 isoform X1 [Pectinophora gossypiella]|nr:putative nuclease HARBI1 isoform X1 [Pectinophora gossypiella]